MEKYKFGIFQQASKFLLPQTQIFDFFDFVAGKKLQLPQSETHILQSQQIKFQMKSIQKPENAYQIRLRTTGMASTARGGISKSKNKNNISKQQRNHQSEDEKENAN